MNIEDFRNYCLSIKGATESCPFLDKNILVLKVMDKMFTYINLMPKDRRFRASMKCNPEKAAELRDRYEGIVHGDHTKSYDWNAVYLESDVPDGLIKELILHSVEEVVKKMPKKRREEYNSLQK